MLKKHLNYDLSLKLKNIGYVEKGYAYYQCSSFFGNDLTPSFVFFENKQYDNTAPFIMKNDCVSPLINDVIDWLDSKGIFVHTFFDGNVFLGDIRFNNVIYDIKKNGQWNSRRELYIDAIFVGIDLVCLI